MSWPEHARPACGGNRARRRRHMRSRRASRGRPAPGRHAHTTRPSTAGRSGGDLLIMPASATTSPATAHRRRRTNRTAVNSSRPHQESLWAPFTTPIDISGLRPITATAPGLHAVSRPTNQMAAATDNRGEQLEAEARDRRVVAGDSHDGRRRWSEGRTVDRWRVYPEVDDALGIRILGVVSRRVGPKDSGGRSPPSGHTTHMTRRHRTRSEAGSC